jgi:hypothetical protein
MKMNFTARIAMAENTDQRDMVSAVELAACQWTLEPNSKLKETKSPIKIKIL